MENSNKLISQNIDFDKDEIDLKSLFGIFKRGKKLIFLIVLSSTFITGIYSIKTKPKWAGSFNIVVKNSSNNSNNLNLLDNFSGNFKNGIVNDTNETERLILQSPSVLMPVFDFVKKYYEDNNINTDKLFFKEWAKSNLKINFEDQSSVLKVEYFSKDKKLILEVLELISSKYKEYSKRDTEKQLTKTIEYLEQQIELMKEKSLTSLKAFNEFSIKNGLGSIDGFVGINDSLSLGLLDKNNSNISLGEQKIDSIQTNLSGSNAGLRFDSQFKMLEKYEARFVDLSSKLKPNSNTLKELQRRIDNLRDALERPNEILLEYRKLNVEAARDESLLQELETSLLVFKMKKIETPDPWEMISIPTIDNKPVSPNKKRLLIGSFFISLFIGSFVALIREKFTGKIFSLNEYKIFIKYKYLDTLYDKNIVVNTNIIDSFVDINENIAVIELSNNFFNNEISNNPKFLKEERNISFVNLKNLKTLSKFKKIILITKNGQITKANINLIEKYLLPYEKAILGWFYLD